MAIWQRLRLGDLVETLKGYAFKSSWYCGEGRPIVKVSDFTMDSVDATALVCIPEETAVGYLRYELQTGDVVVQTVGSWPTNPASVVGKCVRVPLNVAGALLNQNAVKLTPANGFDKMFLFYLLRNEDFKTYIFGTAQGAASQAAITLEAIRGYEFDLPPLPIQRRIASVLSAYDELIENNQRRIKILESMARALYREWFVHFRFPGYESVPRVASPLGEIPQGWEVRKLGEISSYINRGITPRYEEGGGSVVINQKCVRDQRLSLEPARRQAKPIPSDKQVCFGDVLINSTGVGTLGRVAQVYENLENCTVDTHVTIARAASNTDLDFYGCCLLNHQETFERLGIGATGQTELGRAAIAEIELVVPPTDVQRQFGVAVKGMRLAAITYGKQIQNLRRTRDLLLPRLLSGQVELETEVT
jgi:type I restriction enzyme S subunit